MFKQFVQITILISFHTSFILTSEKYLSKSNILACGERRKEITYSLSLSNHVSE